jgi:hypothetical protein
MPKGIILRPLGNILMSTDIILQLRVLILMLVDIILNHLALLLMYVVIIMLLIQGGQLGKKIIHILKVRKLNIRARDIFVP